MRASFGASDCLRLEHRTCALSYTGFWHILMVLSSWMAGDGCMLRFSVVVVAVDDAAMCGCVAVMGDEKHIMGNGCNSKTVCSNLRLT